MTTVSKVFKVLEESFLILPRTNLYEEEERYKSVAVMNIHTSLPLVIEEIRLIFL